jgi:hypothetical protein
VGFFKTSHATMGERHIAVYDPKDPVAVEYERHDRGPYCLKLAELEPLIRKAPPNQRDLIIDEYYRRLPANSPQHQVSGAYSPTPVMHPIIFISFLHARQAGVESSSITRR